MMNKYFMPTPETLEELKKLYRQLALKHHPDVGGDSESMKAINNEYDALFPIYQIRYNMQAPTANTESAASTRREFYTQNGWQGENYSSKLSLKEIACLIREFIKIHYNDFKFSVTTSYASMCQSLHIDLMESPYRAYKYFDELTEELYTYDCEYNTVIRKYTQAKNIGSWHRDELNNLIRPLYDKNFGEEERLYLPKFLTEKVKEATGAVAAYTNSFNYDDSDSQIDYFDTNFYFHGVQIGKWDKPYKIVEREKKNIPTVEYENVKVTKTRTSKVLEAHEIEMPDEFEPGQLFQLKRDFNYGCSRGNVYQIDRIHSDYIIAYKMGKGYKNICKGRSQHGNSFSTTSEKLQAWVNKDSIKFIKLIETTKTEEYTSSVRRPKKHTGLSMCKSENTSSPEPTQENIDEYTITADKDTRDNSNLWILKIIKILTPEEYKQIANKIKTINGHYSKFKHGFIFRYDPTEAIKEVI